MFKVELIGNLGADAEVKSSEGSKFVAFRVANTEKWTDGNGQEHVQTDWFDAILSNVESKVIPFLKAGVKVFIRGNATKRVYSSKKDRCMKAGITVHVQELELCGGSSDDVPRQLIDTETGALVDVAKYYWANADTKSMKKADTRVFADRQGKMYVMDSRGFVTPYQEPSDDAAESNQDQG